jgi:Fe-S oxidoreductase
MAVLGLEQDLISSQWPWKCTLCGSCEEACPMNVEIVSLLRRVRSLKDRARVPASLQSGLQLSLKTGNGIGIAKADFSAMIGGIVEDMAREECPGLKPPLDIVGANLLVTVNSRQLSAQSADIQHWWKILHAAGESWTIPSEDWDGTNWGFFTCDDEAVKTLVCRMVENMYRLKCRTLLFPESGHAYFAMRYGLNRWFKNELKSFQVVSVFDLLMSYLRDGRLKVDSTRHSQLTTYHDPCHYGRRSLKAFGQGYFEQGRIITRRCVENFVEMYPDREGNYCCGAGGGIWAMPYKEEKILHGCFKARQIEGSRAKLVVAPCYDCRDQIKNSLCREYELDVEVKGIGELVADSLVLSNGRTVSNRDGRP